MYTITSALATWNIKRKRVFLRADLNVPLSSTSIVHDHRLQAIEPTISMLLEKGSKIILATHLGRPKNPSEGLSTKLLVPWFKKQGYDIEHVVDLGSAHTKSLKDSSTIILLENLRFFPGEKNKSNYFAKQLAQLADFYVNDAFATLHRNDTSIVVLPTYFEPEKKTIGLLVEKEITTLNKLLGKPKKPFILIIGGDKINDKIPTIINLLDLISTIMLCPAAVFSFLHAQGEQTGKSLVDQSMRQVCLNILTTAAEKNIRILMPKDYIVATKTFTGLLSTISADNFPKNGIGVSIGPTTAHEWERIIKKAETIFYTGLMGTIQKKDTLIGVQKIFSAMGASQGLSIIGGGDSVAAAQLLGLDHAITFCSTGGSATLTYLASEKLPGLDQLI